MRGFVGEDRANTVRHGIRRQTLKSNFPVKRFIPYDIAERRQRDRLQPLRFRRFDSTKNQCTPDPRP